MKEHREAKQWEDVPPGGQAYSVTLYAPDGDIERTLLDERGRRADCIMCACAVSAAPMNEEGGENVAEGYRVGFLLLTNASSLAMDLEEKAVPPLIADLVENFHAAMRATFGVDAVNEAGRILQEERRQRRAEAMKDLIRMTNEFFGN